jgi:hypothetical protein
MRTQNFSQILFDALQYSGKDRYNINRETFGQFRDFCNSRIREAWENQLWADVCRVAEFTTVVDASGVTYFIPNAECGEVLGVYTLNPLVSSRAVGMNYQLYDTGTELRIVLETTTIATGWYYYRTKVPSLTGELFDPVTVYYAGSQVYFDSGSSTGTYIPVSGKPHSANFYTCLETTSAGQSPSTTPTKWKIEKIPYIFSQFMAWGACANWFASETLLQEALAIDSKARLLLEDEMDKQVNQQNQIPKLKFTNPYSR